MTLDEFIKLLEALVKLLSVVIWPALLFFVLVRFGPSLRDFFSSLGEFTVKGGVNHTGFRGGLLA